MFVKTTKSFYTLFVKIKGLKENPNLVLKESELNKYGHYSKEELSSFNDEKILEIADQNIEEIYLPVSILIKNEIARSLKLEKLGVYNLTSMGARNKLKTLRALTISSKPAGVKAGLLKFWRADFETTVENLPPGFRKEQKISFISPPDKIVDDIEAHLVSLGNIPTTVTDVNYKYIRNSAKLVGGRKYKSN